MFQPNKEPKASLSCVQTARARARGRGSFVCGRGHESRYKPHKPREPRACVAPNAVGTSKGGSQACKGRWYVQLSWHVVLAA